MTVPISCLNWNKGLWIRALSFTEICYSLSLNYNFRLPQSLQRAMAAEAEAAREARAKVIAAEGEMKASKVNYLFHRYSKASRYTAFLFAGFERSFRCDFWVWSCLATEIPANFDSYFSWEEFHNRISSTDWYDECFHEELIDLQDFFKLHRKTKTPYKNNFS